MKSASQITAVALAAGMAFSQLSCGDASADGKEKSKVEKKAPAQPAKPVSKSDEEWQKILTPEQFEILRNHQTERPWGRAYYEFKKQGEGTYCCAGCNAELFSSKEKFDARCGWPAFFDTSKHENIKTVRDVAFGTVRVEVRCNVCDGHLGHVFTGEGFDTPTDQRYCINGEVLKFVPKVATGDDPSKGKDK
ncbi:MAG: peptide-methionine (R)-S-oxide reductase MsrB [Roseibacillus sp.]|jgi:peptide-methionine (R)-S-oxide reductase|nr:peptide-methionine (R)-S-oxide reductase MsrB [Roseibacillus sp.]